MDTVSKEQRHSNMSHIKGKNTSLELKVRKRLYHDGYRYRVNVPNLPGKPDIVLSKYNTIIFINGCFWHRHNCKLATPLRLVPNIGTKSLSVIYKMI